MLSLKINPTETERILSLYYHDEHFDVITKDNAFLGHSFYCTKCDRAYKANPHVCETRKCTQCKNFCKPSTEVIKCQFCLAISRGMIVMIAIDIMLTTHRFLRVKSGKNARCVICTFQKICKKNTFV